MSDRVEAPPKRRRRAVLRDSDDDVDGCAEAPAQPLARGSASDERLEANGAAGTGPRGAGLDGGEMSLPAIWAANRAAADATNAAREAAKKEKDRIYQAAYRKKQKEKKQAAALTGGEAARDAAPAAAAGPSSERARRAAAGQEEAEMGAGGMNGAATQRALVMVPRGPELLEVSVEDRALLVCPICSLDAFLSSPFQTHLRFLTCIVFSLHFFGRRVRGLSEGEQQMGEIRGKVRRRPQRPAWRGTKSSLARQCVHDDTSSSQLPISVQRCDAISLF